MSGFQNVDISKLPRLWLRADTLTGTTGSVVSSWPSSGRYTGSFAGKRDPSITTGPAGPTLGSTGGLQHVRFDRTYKQFMDNNASLPFNWSSTGMTAALVMQFIDAPANYYYFLNSTGSAPGFRLARSNAGEIVSVVQNSTGSGTFYRQFTTYATPTAWTIYMWRILLNSTGTAGNIETLINTVTFNPASRAAFTILENRTYPAQNFVIGTPFNPGGSPPDLHLHANVREFQVYDTALSDADMVTLYNSLKTRWNM